MDTSKECLKDDGPRGCWTGCQIGEEKGEGPGGPGERIYRKRWHGETYEMETGKIESMAGRMRKTTTAVKKSTYIYIYRRDRRKFATGPSRYPFKTRCMTRFRTVKNVGSGVS
jgi:hypothetical protein